MAKKKRKWPKYAAMGVTAGLLTGSLALVLVDKFAPDQTYLPQSLVQLPSKAVAAVLRPFQGAFAWATQGVTGYLESWKLSKNIEIEYNKLKAQNDQLTYEAMYVRTLEDENERLRNMLGVFQDNIEQNPIMATVTGKETSNWFQKFTIDRGSRHGLKEYMAVINEKGLIGYIDTVYETSAEVLSIIDSRAGVSGLIESSREQGMVRGTLGVGDEPTCRMYYLPVDFIPRPGDVVVTSGIGMPFPKGIKIGVVRESTRHTDANKRYVVIEPEVDFEHIEEVIVLIYEPDTEEMPDADDGQISYVASELDTPRPYPGLGEQIGDEELGAVTPPPRATRSVDGGADTTADPLSTSPPDLPTAEGVSGENGEGADLPTLPPDGGGSGDQGTAAEPTPTPTPDPEMNQLLQEELENEEGNG